MARTITRGKCQFCQAEFSKGTMTRHLLNCKERQLGATTTRSKAQLFHLVVEGRHNSKYWLHLEMSSKATLADLDRFLRAIWLECCGHLSAFKINDKFYTGAAVMGYDRDEEAMEEAELGKVVAVGQHFEHEYDFGTTTELKLKIVGEREGSTSKSKPVQLLAQNLEPQIACNTCGKLASQLCTQCVYEDTGWLCEVCAASHDCGEEMLLPVVNSPRVGMCAYGS